MAFQQLGSPHNAAPAPQKPFSNKAKTQHPYSAAPQDRSKIPHSLPPAAFGGSNRVAVLNSVRSRFPPPAPRIPPARRLETIPSGHRLRGLSSAARSTAGGTPPHGRPTPRFERHNRP